MNPKVQKILDKIKKLQEQLRQEQDVCLHINLEKKHKANTGNWCPSDDRYWTEFKCNDCGKWWVEDGSK